MTLHSLAPKFLYHVQHVFPEDGRQAAAKVDAAIRQAVASCVGDAVVEDDIAKSAPAPARACVRRRRQVSRMCPLPRSSARCAARCRSY